MSPWFVPLSGTLGSNWEQLRLLHCRERIGKALHRRNRLDRRRLDVVLPGDTVVAMTKDHGRDSLSDSDALKIRREPSSESVPTFPFNGGLSQRLFHLPVVQRIEVNRLSCTVREDRTESRIAASVSVLLEKCIQLWY